MPGPRPIAEISAPVARHSPSLGDAARRCGTWRSNLRCRVENRTGRWRQEPSAPGLLLFGQPQEFIAPCALRHSGCIASPGTCASNKLECGVVRAWGAAPAKRCTPRCPGQVLGDAASASRARPRSSVMTIRAPSILMTPARFSWPSCRLTLARARPR